MAECVCAEAAGWLDDDRPMTLAPTLAACAARLYARNPDFARRLRARGNVGREWLRSFMRHWLAGALRRLDPALFDALPEGFCVGLAPRGPKARRQASPGQRPGSPAWKPAKP